MRRNLLTIILVASALIAVGVGCGSKTPPPAQYVGVWMSGDGATITIRSDGSADYKSANSSVSGGSAVIDEGAKTLKISLAGLGPTFKIDKPPTGSEMTLDGIVFKKDGGSTSSTTSNDGPSEVPTTAEVDQLLTKTFTDFTNGVEEGSLADFHKNTSAPWREQYTQEETDEFFKSFFENKEKVLPSLKNAIAKKPVITEDPKLDTQGDFKQLTLVGNFASKPYRVKFEAEYYWSEGRWGIKRFKVNM
jgi:hypothetical protein